MEVANGCFEYDNVQIDYKYCTSSIVPCIGYCSALRTEVETTTDLCSGVLGGPQAGGPEINSHNGQAEKSTDQAKEIQPYVQIS